MMDFLFLKTPLFFFIQSFWRDEAFSYLLAKKNILEIIIHSAKDFNPPLYYIILHFWIKIFGSSEIAIRSLSLIFFWATIYVAFLFLENILKIKSRLFRIIYLSLFIINPLLVYYGFEARMYSMFAFFSLLSFYSLLKKDVKTYLIATVFGMYTHYFMIFVVLIQLLIFKSKKQIISLILFIPWITFLIIKNQNLLSSFWIQSSSKTDLINFIGRIYTGYENTFNFFENKINNIKNLSIIIILIIISGFLIKPKNNYQKKIFKTLILWSIPIPFLIMIISFIKPIFNPRYLIFANIGLILLMIFIIEKYPIYLKIFVLSIIFLITLNYNNLQIKERKKANLKKTIYEIKKLMKKDDVLYVINELDFFTAQYYLDEKKVYIWGKNYDELPPYIGKTLIPKEKIIYNLPIYPKKAFILYSSGEYLIQSLY